MAVRRTYPPDLASELREVASFVGQSAYSQAFTALARLQAIRPRARVAQLLRELRPYATPDAALLAVSEEESGTGEDDLDLEETSMLEAIAAMLRPRVASEDDLWAAVYADPRCDEARLVLADALAGRGDPRGEFIVLQLSPALGSLDERGARERELLKQFGNAWLGSSRFKVIDPVFRRGFLAEGKFVGDLADIDDPSWRTLEVLERNDHAAWPPILHPNFRSLRKVFGLSGELLERAGREAISLDVEHLGICPRFSAFAEPDLRRRVLPRLARVDVATPGELDLVLGWAAEAGLVVGCNEPMEALPRLARQILEATVPFELVMGLRGSWTHVANDWPRWSVRMCRVHEGEARRLIVEATHHGGDDANTLLAALEGLPIERLILTRKGRPRANEGARAALMAELLRRGVVAELRGW
jgi:uncharacterized protein (TIGR02996 family)